jgi:ferric-dicitrate binding protein FerR (iron transport regulator)
VSAEADEGANTPDAPGGRDERELEDLLRRVPHDSPDPRRRQEARAAFLAGASRPAGFDRTVRPMSNDLGHPEGRPDERINETDGFVDWLAAHGAAAPPADDAKRRARLAFLSAVASDVRPLRRERRSVRLLVFAAAAAAILAVTFLLPERARWRATLAGPARLAGRDYGVGEGARLAAELEGSGRLEALAGGATLELGDGLVVELLPGAAMEFPVMPELDGLSVLDLELAHGEAFLRTRASYAGNPIVVRTASADVRLSGTAVGVLVGDFGTCVCVAEGRARVASALLGGEREVAARTTLRVFEEAGIGAEVEPFPDDDAPEAEHTRALVEFARGR